MDVFFVFFILHKIQQSIQPCAQYLGLNFIPVEGAQQFSYGKGGIL